MTGIEVVDLSKVYGKGKDSEGVRALDMVNLSVPEGSFVSILGPSGCGKSTLLRIVAGLLPATSGSVTIAGTRVLGPNPDVGIVFQSPVLLPWRTVLQNIELTIEFRGLARRKYRDKTLALIRLLGLGSFERSLPHQLSGGMQQRVAIGRALIHDPPVLLMDEPFGALDAFTREQLNLEVQRIWLETKKTVLFITHSITEALFLSDRVAIMSPRPGHVAAVIPVKLPRPRSFKDLQAPEFQVAERSAREVVDNLWRASVG
jgi:NitT/TauT family transport system ATP-binding protein